MLTVCFFISRLLSMKTPRFRTHREAVIVETPARITLPLTSAAVDLGTVGRYRVLPSFVRIEFHAIHCLRYPPFATQ